jgi:phosphoribosyl-ATP pyrophosphohydrolase
VAVRERLALQPHGERLVERLAAHPSVSEAVGLSTCNRCELYVVGPDREAMAEAAVLERLWRTVEERRRSGDVLNSHSARLLARGTAKVAQKLGEEAVECVIEATQGHRAETILESADLLYHLMVVWVDAGIRPEEVWAELRRREGISGIVEKASRPKGIVRAAKTTKLP